MARAVAPPLLAVAAASASAISFGRRDARQRPNLAPNCRFLVPGARGIVAARCEAPPVAKLEARNGWVSGQDNRLLQVRADGADELGRELGSLYRHRILNGLARSMECYLAECPTEAIAWDDWARMAALAREGAELSCPTAAAFFRSIEPELGVDVYLTMLDFEVWQFATQWYHSGRTRRSGGTGRCTGFAFVDGNCALVAQNSDLPYSPYAFGDFDCALHLQLSESAGALVLDVDGRLCPIGINSAGLGVCIFNLQLLHEDGWHRPSVSLQTIVWELLLGQYTLDQALVFLRSLPAPAMCGSGLLLADSTGAVNVELNSTGLVVVPQPTSGEPLVRANHPTDALGLEAYADSQEEADFSYERVELLRGHLRGLSEAGAHMDCDLALEALKLPRVCNRCTLASVALDLRSSRLLVDFCDRLPSSEEQPGGTPERAPEKAPSGRTASGRPSPSTYSWKRATFNL